MLTRRTLLSLIPAALLAPVLKFTSPVPRDLSICEQINAHIAFLRSVGDDPDNWVTILSAEQFDQWEEERHELERAGGDCFTYNLTSHPYDWGSDLGYGNVWRCNGRKGEKHPFFCANKAIAYDLCRFMEKA